MRTSAHPRRDARSASPGERVSPQTSLTMVAPAATAATATSSLYVSMETGTFDSIDRRLTTSSVRVISSSVLTGTCPGRVDSPPTSSITAPSRTMRIPCATAASRSCPRPSPLNESGATFTIPITYVRLPHSNLRPPMSAITRRLCCESDMRLEDLARGVPGAVLEGNGDVEVAGIAYDSRQAKPGDLVGAVKGITTDGHSYLAGAVAAGAAAVAVDSPAQVRPRPPVLRHPAA